MHLIDGAWYQLPDGTYVQANDNQVWGATRWQLLTTDEKPAYVFTGGAWKRMHYDPATEGYTVAPCDLTTDDLRPAEIHNE
jgi:hypothetical protein